MGATRFDHVTKHRDVCRTPGTVYTTAFLPDHVRLAAVLPAPLLASLTKEEEAELVKLFHEAMLAPMEELFRRKWPLLAGQTIDGTVMPDTWEEL